MMASLKQFLSRFITDHRECQNIQMSLQECINGYKSSQAVMLKKIAALEASLKGFENLKQKMANPKKGTNK